MAGVVQLGGFVDNAQQKDQATKVARSVRGVRKVRNDLLVSTKPHAETKAHQINVGTQQGVVQLTGFVDPTTMKAKAGAIARSVDGVKDVRNDLEIRQKQRRSGRGRFVARGSIALLPKSAL